MSILVVCPGCRKSFKVNEKFAGKTGPCPKCKHTIQVPAKAEEVQVHAPTEFATGGRSVSGELLTKPIARQEVRVQPVTVAAIAAAAVVVLLVTVAAGRKGLFDNILVGVAGLLLLSPALAVAAYTFLRNDELEPYRGPSLWLRAAICGTAYTILWGVFSYLSAVGFLTGELWMWVFVVPPFLAVGGLAALAALDLDYTNACFHYAFYVLVTVVLRWAAGLQWVWQTSSNTPLM